MVPGAKRPPPIAPELVNTGLLLEGDTRGRGEGALAVRGFGVASDGDDGFRVWPGGMVSRFPSASGSSAGNVAFGSLSRGAPHFAQNRAVSAAAAPHEVQNMEPGFYHSHRRLIITRSSICRLHPVCRLHLEYGSRKGCLPGRKVPLLFRHQYRSGFLVWLPTFTDLPMETCWRRVCGSQANWSSSIPTAPHRAQCHV